MAALVDDQPDEQPEDYVRRGRQRQEVVETRDDEGVLRLLNRVGRRLQNVLIGRQQDDREEPDQKDQRDSQPEVAPGAPEALALGESVEHLLAALGVQRRQRARDVDEVGQHATLSQRHRDDGIEEHASQHQRQRRDHYWEPRDTSSRGLCWRAGLTRFSPTITPGRRGRVCRPSARLRRRSAPDRRDR